MELIQQKLRELEMLAHDMHVPLELIELGIRRQFYYAELERNKGNRCKTARSLKVHRNTVLRWDEKLNVNAGEIRAKARRA